LDMDDKKNQQRRQTSGDETPRFNFSWFYILMGIGLIYLLMSGSENSSGTQKDYTKFKNYVEKGYAKDIVVDKRNLTLRMIVDKAHVRDVLGVSPEKAGKNPSIDVEFGSMENLENFLDDETEKGHFKGSVTYEHEDDLFYNLLWQIGPLLLIIVVWILIMRRAGSGGMGGGIFNVGKSKAKLFEKDGKDVINVTFKDVAGQAEAKQEVREIVDFLKNPEKYTRLGGKIPKGALLVGPPGTGKTLLAKAVAGEANVPFFSMSGSDFVEMFVGVGASRVRDLFQRAKEKAPCIIFIDEIDAIGRARSKNSNMGGNDERESTLNQLLTEMDGFGTNSGVIIMAATNRVDILDKALLRAGRFDRQIHVELPDVNERKEIFNVHLRPVKIDETVDVDMLARQTPGFSGADIANVCNEAALIAARHDAKWVGRQDFLDAIDRIIGGLEKKNKVMTDGEKRTIALHEAGHATVSWLLEYANPLVKVTIVPRGQALGAAWYMPEERQITTKEQMLDEVCALLGGRAAEELFTGHISSGAVNDLERVTKNVYGMIAYAGMGENLPNLCYYNNQEYQFSKPYSEHTAEIIDDEVKKLIAVQYDRAKSILSTHKEGHGELANILFEREVIFAEDVEKIFGKRPWTSRTEEILASNNGEGEQTETTESEKATDPNADFIRKKAVEALVSKIKEIEEKVSKLDGESEDQEKTSDNQPSEGDTKNPNDK